MDRIISTLGSLMLSGLVLLAAWMFSGGLYWMEGRQKPVLEVVAMLGGRLGFWGGATLLVGVALATYGLHQSLNYYTALVIIRGFIKTGHSPEAVARRIERFRLSDPMKRRLLAAIAPKPVTPDDGPHAPSEPGG